MKILFIGDIFGRPGRMAVEKILKTYREENNVDFVIANAENLRHGRGVSEKNIKDMQQAGVDFFTSGNHVFDDRELVPFLDNPKLPLIRPANYPPNVPGRGYEIVETALKKKILVINLLGRVFVKEHSDCPFRKADEILSKFANVKMDAIFVDFHAEATSEKNGLANYLDGRVTAVIGTHTHVATADARILPRGTAYQSDVGFTGPIDSVIGVKKEIMIDHFLTQMRVKHEVAQGPVVFNAVEIAVNDNNIQSADIKPVHITIDDL
jgi:2',3'-cyclic-nucleotide 2'-phosphodiesterase